MSLASRRFTHPFWDRQSEYFPDPFCDAASLAMPRSIEEALAFSEQLLHANGTYREALRRVVSYFVTDLEIGGEDCSREEKQKYKDYLINELNILEEVHAIGMDYLGYGNSISTVLPPFRRYLACPRCHMELPYDRMQQMGQFRTRWDFATGSFLADCPRCHFVGAWRRVDRRGREESKVVIKRWNVHEMEILHDQLRDECAYVWKIPEEYRRDIREGVPFKLARANWDVVQVIRANKHLMLSPDVVYHMAERSMAGLRSRGWGIPRTITNFRQAWYLQLLMRYNEAIGLDYVIPLRVITPAAKGGADAASMDPAIGVDMGDFQMRVQAMLEMRRRDPATWHTLSYPIDYKMLGGDATTLAPKDLIDQAQDALLSAVGVPPELYRGTLSMQAAPTSLRLFQSHWSGLVAGLNGFLQHVADRVAALFNWEPVEVRLTPVTHADDINRQMAKLQLMSARQISQRTGLQSIGADFEAEQTQMLEEERFVAEKQKELQEQMVQQEGAQQFAQDPLGTMAGGAAAAGGMPAQGGAAAQFSAGTPPGPNTPTTPQELYQNAQTIAQQLAAMSESQKDSELIQLKRQDPMLHTLVKSQLQVIRQEQQAQQEVQSAGPGMQQKVGNVGGLMAMRRVRARGIRLDL